MRSEEKTKKIVVMLLLLSFLCSNYVSASLDGNSNKIAQSVIIGQGNYETDKFIVKYKNDHGDNSEKTKECFQKMHKGKLSKVEKIKSQKGQNFEWVVLNQKLKTKDIYDALAYKNNNIEYIQPDYQISLMSKYASEEISPELIFELEHELLIRETKSISSVEQEYVCDAAVQGAWEKTNGEGVLVAVIDTGIDATHEDLAGNIWKNTEETPDNSLDDDGNGFVDDVFGWNFIDDNNIVCIKENIIQEKHGTYAAGIIAAVKDYEKGIAGTAPKAKIMPLKVFKDGVAYTSDIIAAIEYAEKMGARVVNASWGSTMDNRALKEAIENSEMLFVCAAGNSGTNIPVSQINLTDTDRLGTITDNKLKGKAKNSDDVESGGVELGTVTTLNSLIINANTVYVYDERNRLDYMQLQSGEIIDFQYDNNGNLIRTVRSQL